MVWTQTPLCWAEHATLLPGPCPVLGGMLQGPTPRAGPPGIVARLSLLSGTHVACTSLAPPPLPASCSYGNCPCHAAALVALDWMLAWPLGHAVLALRAPAPTMTPCAAQQYAPCSHTGRALVPLDQPLILVQATPLHQVWRGMVVCSGRVA
jgi:hypothetical protein